MGKEGSGLARAQGPGGLRERCGFRCSRGLRPPCTQAASDSSMPPGAPPLQSPVPCRLPYLAFPQFAPFLSSLETLSEPLSSLVCDPEEMWGSSLESHPLRQTWRASLSFPGAVPFRYLAVDPRFRIGAHLSGTPHFSSTLHALPRAGRTGPGRCPLPALRSFSSASCSYVASGSEVPLGLYDTLFKIHKGDHIFFFLSFPGVTNPLNGTHEPPHTPFPLQDFSG